MTPRALASVTLCAFISGCGGARPPETASSGGTPSPAVLIVDPALSAPAQRLGEREPELRIERAPAGPTAITERARGMVDAARQRYVAIEFEDTLATIREAVVLLESDARTREDFDLLADALLVRGMAELGLGRDDAARTSLLAAARLRPDRELDEGRYPPQVRERYEALRAELRAEPASSITVTTQPAGALLFFDGERRGTAPDTLYATSGRHQLRVSAFGHAERTLAVALDPDGDQIEIDLPAVDRDGAIEQLWAADAAALANEDARNALARALGTTLVARARQVEDGVEVTRIDLGSGRAATETGASLDVAYHAVPAPGSGEGSAPADEEAYRHEGFYARLTLGTALRGDEQKTPDGMPDQAGGGSLALDFELAVGGSLAPGVVLGGALMGLAGAPALDFEARGKPEITVPTALALFLAWYPSPRSGWHVLGLIGGARGERTGGEADLDDSAFIGGVGGLGGGYEWWIASEWSAGVMGRFLLYSLREDGDADVIWTMLSFGIAGTVTFN